MRLADSPASSSGLEADVQAILNARLARESPRPIAVAFSGGGDSLALLLIACEWARRAGRPLLALTVDHRLQPQSAAWTDACAQRAEGLGAAFRALAWTGPKPATGLPAAARAARHTLVADAAREAGARVVLMGHTADDVLEARAMRQAGGATPEPREWAPSPAWPEGRGVFLLRPLLGVRRAALRAWLAERGEHWIEDPANADLRYARARARATLPPGAEALSAAAEPSAAALARACRLGEDGTIGIARRALHGDQAAGRFVSAACVCAGGAERPPAAHRASRLLARLTGPTAFAASLAGARIEADAERVLILREAGEAARGGLAALRLAAGASGVWDGRFEIEAARPITVRPLAGAIARLPAHERAALRATPAKARPALPAIFEEAALLGCPLASPVAGVAVRALVGPRLLAACGAVEREPEG